MRKYFTEALKFFNTEDDYTRKTLLHLDEAGQNTVLLSLTNKLYKMIVDKVEEIDFGDIPDSKGDTKRLPKYDETVTCLDTIRKILIQYKQPTDSVDAIVLAFKNIEDRTELWKRGYSMNIEIIQVMYCEMVLSVYNSLSYMIAATIEYVKIPNNDGFEIAINKTGIARTRDSMIYGALLKFNDACAAGQIEKVFDPLIKAKAKNFAITGLVVGLLIAAGGIYLLSIILPILREVAFYFYSIRVRVSEYLDMQADLLEMNAANIEMNKVDTTIDRDKVIKRQKSIAQMFRTLSNKICLDNTKANKEGNKEIEKSEKKMKINDVVDTAPDGEDNPPADNGSIF